MKLGERSVGGVVRCLAAASVVFASARGFAQEAAIVAPISPAPDVAVIQKQRPQLIAVRTSQAPAIDGNLGDSAWAQVAPTTAFTQKFPNEAASPTEATELRVLYDDSTLYVAFNCIQTATPVTARLARRDRQVESDWVQVEVGDGANAYEFSINAAGVLSDGLRFNDTDFSADWDAVWDARVVQHERGWSAEMSIPLRIFRHSIGTSDWGFQARRYISQRQETDEWAFIPRAVAGEISHYGSLSGVADVRRTNPLELLPYVSGGANWSDMKPGGRVLGDLGYSATAGVDLAWRIGKDLTLDATINPDFAQVEIDQLVLNLTTYETFVPEKRPFFLAGMAVFQLPRMELMPTSQTLFYTRRIGAAPATPVTGATGVPSTPEPSTIYAAAKLTGRLAPGVSIGLVSAVTGRNDATIEAPGAPSQDFLADPLAVANVARIKVAVAGGANLGVLATALRRLEPENAYPMTMQSGGEQVQQCPDGSKTAPGARCFHDAYVAGLDGSWRSGSGTYFASGQALVTSIQNGPPRTLLDGTVIRSGDTSPMGRVYVAKEGGNWLGTLEAQAIGRRVDDNDLGYLQRQNLVRTLAWLAYRTLDPFWVIAETETHVFAATRDNLDGVKLLRGYYGGGKVRFKNFWIATADLYRYDVRFEDRLAGDGTAVQRPSANGLDVSLNTDPRRALAASLATETLVFPVGGSFTLTGNVRYQPVPRFELQLLPQLTVASGDPKLVAGGRAAGEYVFGDLRARAVGATLRSSYAFTNRLTLQLYGQVLGVSKHYTNFRSFAIDPAAPRPVIRFEDMMPADAPPSRDSAATNLNVNAVLRWEFRPGSTLFLVYSRFQAPDLVLDGDAKLDFGALRNGPATDAIRLKLSYYWN